jgi:gas vesicle protein
MGECKIGSGLAFLLAGIAIGAGLAILFAPESGRETRKYISRRAADGTNYVTSLGRELRRQVEDVVDRGKDLAARLAP